jgi:putative hemolysin
MSDTVFEIVFILVLIFANGILAMAETAVISARKARLQQRAEEGDEKALAALTLAVDPADFLSASQIGITLVGVLAGAFGGATIARELAVILGRIEPLKPYSQGIAIILVVRDHLSFVDPGRVGPKASGAQ